MNRLDGINTHIPNEMDIKNVSKCKLRKIRVDFNWCQIESKRNQYSWDKLDKAIKLANEYNLEVYADIAYSPSWVARQIEDCPPADLFEEFVSIAVDRYVGKVKYWGVWNEPNLQLFYTGTKKDYVNNILIPGLTAIKETDPNAIIVGGDIATTSDDSWLKWVDLMYNNRKYFDVFAMHTYQHSVKKLKNKFVSGKLPPFGWISKKNRPWNWAIEKFKDAGKEIWLTETGFKTNSFSNSELNDQKKYIKELQSLSKKVKLDSIFIYDTRDDNHFADKWGIFYSNGEPKPAAEHLIGE